MRVPLLTGSRLSVATLPDHTTLLAPPLPPGAPLADVSAAVREALRYPLAGPSLEAVAHSAKRVTVVVEPSALPIPDAPLDPRRTALAALLTELDAHAPDAATTLLVANGLGVRPDRRVTAALFNPADARGFRGEVVVHDCEADDLVTLGSHGRTHVRCHRALVETDLIVIVGASETVLHGGPSALIAACSPATIRSYTAASLLEARTAPGWSLAGYIETELARTAPMIAVTVVLDLPRVAGRYRGYPSEPSARAAAVASPFRRALGIAPAAVREAALGRVPLQLDALAVLAGPPATAHAEALVRGTSLRAIPVDQPFDTIVVPVGWIDTHHPRRPLDALGVATVALGHALRLWRGRPPLREAGTVVIAHPLGRASHAAQIPTVRVLLDALRSGEASPRVRAAEAAAQRDTRQIAEYRRGRSPHPRQVFADWHACASILELAGRVIVAGCRDANAARALGFVPTHNLGTALKMATGLAPASDRIGVLLAPPFAPLDVAVAPEPGQRRGSNSTKERPTRDPGRPSARPGSS